MSRDAAAEDKGDYASVIDKTLTRAFKVAATWKAIILIDEADIFLHERSMSDLPRSAVVAVFLHHLECVF